MRTYLIRATLALAVVLAVSAPAVAQSIVRGRVVDAAGKPIEGAAVTIEGIDSSARIETKTDRNGEFLQVGLTSGRYSVTAVKGAFRQILPANVSRGKPTQLSFQLSPTSGLTPEQIKANQEMQALAEAALEAMRAGREDEGIQKFNEIIAKMPTCSDCYSNLGVAYTKKQQFAEAEAAFQKAIELAPNSGEPYAGLANLYNTQKKFDLAQQASEKAASLTAASGGGGSAEALYNQGVILWNAGKYAEAKAQYESAVKVDPSMAMAYYQLGMANLNLGEIPSARQAFEAYLKLDPNGPKSAEVKVFVQQLPQ
ncbi:MAG: tetratricopeptide repeat protein [Acidobacteria bacterium]|nr:tetratricopeptide repeat protein [Acidobacteriota bacterium]